MEGRDQAHRTEACATALMQRICCTSRKNRRMPHDTSVGSASDAACVGCENHHNRAWEAIDYIMNRWAAEGKNYLWRIAIEVQGESVEQATNETSVYVSFRAAAAEIGLISYVANPNRR